MKLWIISDLHCEFGQPFVQPPPPGADVLVCAGDVLTRGIPASIEWLATNIPPSMPVVFTAGNHEYYGASVQESIRDARLLRGRHPNIHWLENQPVDIGGLRFIGATLWTDFRINGGDPELAMAAAQGGMNDYKRINLSKLPFKKFKPIHAYRMHHESRAFLRTALAESSTRKTVVVSHHAPSPRSIPAEFQGDPLSACYASDLENLIVEAQPLMWVHGHVHQTVDYCVERTRVLANPRGYPGEKTGFDPRFVVEI